MYTEARNERQHEPPALGMGRRKYLATMEGPDCGCDVIRICVVAADVVMLVVIEMRSSLDNQRNLCDYLPS